VPAGTAPPVRLRSRPAVPPAASVPPVASGPVPYCSYDSVISSPRYTVEPWTGSVAVTGSADFQS